MWPASMLANNRTLCETGRDMNESTSIATIARKNYYRHALRHENIEKAQAVFPEPVTDHEEEYEQRKGHRDDQLARNGEGIGDEPDQVRGQNEHEQRKDEG